jgi:hypothetical protein
MSTLYGLNTRTTTSWAIGAVTSATEVFTHEPTLYSTTATHTVTGNARKPGRPDPDVEFKDVIIVFNVLVDLPLECDAIYEFNATNDTVYGFNWQESGFVQLQPNPDIAGLGVSGMLDISDDGQALTHH